MSRHQFVTVLLSLSLSLALSLSRSLAGSLALFVSYAFFLSLQRCSSVPKQLSESGTFCTREVTYPGSMVPGKAKMSQWECDFLLRGQPSHGL
jgi:hypothetical protein